MTEQQSNENTLSVLPRGEEQRTTFINRVNEFIKLQDVIESAKESQKDILDAIAEDHIALDESAKKSDINKRVKLLIEEALKAKATEQMQLVGDVLDDYSVISGKLV